MSSNATERAGEKRHSQNPNRVDHGHLEIIANNTNRVSQLPTEQQNEDIASPGKTNPPNANAMAVSSIAEGLRRAMNTTPPSNSNHANDDAVPTAAGTDHYLSSPRNKHDEMQANDKDEDRKPAATRSPDGLTANRTNQDDSNKDTITHDGRRSSSGSDDQPDATTDQLPPSSSHDSAGGGGPGGARPEGERRLSAYEMMRLERIRRNREKLAKLGLQADNGVLGGKKKQRQPHKKQRAPATKIVVPRRSALSRRSKAQAVNYAEPSTSVTAMLRKQKQEEAADRRAQKQAADLVALENAIRSSIAASSSACAVPWVPPAQGIGAAMPFSWSVAVAGAPLPLPLPPKKKKKDPSERMIKDLHLEFKRVAAHKNFRVRQAERNVRRAAREVKFWHGEAARQERVRKKSQERQALERELQRHLGGTLKFVLHNVDARWSELEAAAQRYDARVLDEQKRAAAAAAKMKKAKEPVLTSRQKELLAAVQRFPELLQESRDFLDTVLLARVPGLPNPSRARRSRRSTAAAGREKDNAAEQLQRQVTERLSQLPLDSAACSATLLYAVYESLRRRNVDCNSWLPAYEPPTFWIPQAGDDIEYSASQHKAFVEHHQTQLTMLQGTLPPVKHTDGWKRARVVWTRPVFGNDNETCAVVLAIGMDFAAVASSKKRDCHAVFWFPCHHVHGGARQSSGHRCGMCGETAETSFLRPLPGTADQQLAPDERESAIACLALLKRRALRGASTAHVHPQMTAKNIKANKIPKPILATTKSLPSFDNLFYQSKRDDCKAESADASVKENADTVAGNVSSREGTRHRIRKSAIADDYIGDAFKLQKPTDEPIKQRLAVCGFLPPFAGEGDGQQALPSDHGQVAPFPEACLELVLLRLQAGFYRSRDAIIDDVIESYCTCAVEKLASFLQERKQKTSAQGLVLALNNSSGVTDTSSASASSRIEGVNEWIEMAKPVQEAFAAYLSYLSESQVVEDSFGLSKEVLEPDGGVDGPGLDQTNLQSAARARLELLLKAVGKDALANKYSTTLRNETGMPSVKVKFVCGGEGVSNTVATRTVGRLIAQDSENEIEKIVTIRYNGRSHTVEETVLPLVTACAVFEDTNVDVNVVVDGLPYLCPAEDSHADHGGVPMDSIVRKEKDCLVFARDDYEDNEDLVRLFFGRTNRMNACARCQAYKRSLLVCRVRRGHSNVDFDWVRNFRGLGGIDGLINGLDSDPGQATQASGTAPTAAGGGEEGKNDDDGNEDFAIDPLEMLAKAERALEEAPLVLKNAEEYLAQPVRFSKTFVQENFPIDMGDRHYVFCVVCGLSGDLVCCDGCSNVVHRRCVDMEKLPESEWYCEECVIEGRGPKRATADGDRITSAIDTSARGSEQRQAFQRNEMKGENLADEIDALLDELRDARPDPSSSIREKKSGDRESVSSVAGAGASTDKAQATMVGNGPKKVIYKDDLSDFDDNDSDAGPDSGDENFLPGGRRGGKKTSMQRRRKIDSGDISDPIELLSDMNRRFLKTMGVTDAQSLLNSRTSAVATRFGKWRKREGLPPLKGTGEVASVSTWKAVCRKAAAELGMEDVAMIAPEKKFGLGGAMSSSSSPSKPLQHHVTKRKTVVLSATERARVEAEKAARKDQERLARLQRRTDNAPAVPVPAGIAKKGPRPDVVRQWRTPFEALTGVGQAFANSLGIKSPEEFLNARTGELAEQLAQWRKSQGMSVLKGTGTGATIGAWKTLVRNAMQAMVDLPGPFDSLSKTAQAFLADQGYTEAEAFVQDRNSELAEKLATWRKRQGMTPLKGTGNGATIAAWKSTIRGTLRFENADSPSPSPPARKRPAHDALAPASKRAKVDGAAKHQQESAANVPLQSQVDQVEYANDEGRRSSRGRQRQSPSRWFDESSAISSARRSKESSRLPPKRQRTETDSRRGANKVGPANTEDEAGSLAPRIVSGLLQESVQPPRKGTPMGNGRHSTRIRSSRR